MRVFNPVKSIMLVLPSMNQIMQYMQEMMDNPQIIKDPEMKKHLEDIHEQMHSIMKSMDGKLNDLEQMQKL